MTYKENDLTALVLKELLPELRTSDYVSEEYVHQIILPSVIAKYFKIDKDQLLTYLYNDDDKTAINTLSYKLKGKYEIAMKHYDWVDEWLYRWLWPAPSGLGWK